MEFNFYVEDALLDPPTKRAAYSDRTAWLMAVMSWLAYLPFDRKAGPEELLSIAKALAGESDVETVLAALNQLVAPGRGEDGRVELETKLGTVGFKLEEIFDVQIGAKIDTQAFLARVDLKEGKEEPRSDFLVLAFRGTEPKRLADIRTDLKARMVTVGGDSAEPARVHQGFLEAFMAVKDPINAILRANKELPVYVTGHSLGGALAVVATRYIANRSEGACYTFGSPRVCNDAFAAQIFTPMYRVVNGSDGVAAVPPPGWVMKGLANVMRLTPLPKAVADWLEPFNDYRHYGDQRHLSDAKPVVLSNGVPNYPGLKLRPNPTTGERLQGVLSARAGFLEALGTPLAHHDISKYADKLAYYALDRRRRRKALNRPAAADGSPPSSAA